MATPCSVWDLSSPTRNQTHAPCIGSTESSPLDFQGSPYHRTVNQVPCAIQEDLIVFIPPEHNSLHLLTCILLNKRKGKLFFRSEQGGCVGRQIQRTHQKRQEKEGRHADPPWHLGTRWAAARPSAGPAENPHFK